MKDIKIASIPFLTLIFIIFPMLTTDETGSMGVLVWGGLLLFSVIFSLKEPIRKRTWPYLAILMWFFGVFSTVISPYGEIGHDVIKYLAFVLLLITLSNNHYEKKDFYIASVIYSIVSIVLAILIILSFIYGYPHVDSVFEGDIRFSIGITGIYKNPNYIGAFINLCTFVLLYILFFSKVKLWYKVIILAFISLMVFAIILTGTRAAIITLVSSVFLLFLYNSRKKRFFIIKYLPFIVLVVLGFYYAEDLSEFFDAFGSGRGGFTSDVRSESWDFALKKLKGSLLFGYGINSWNGIKTDSLLPGLHNNFLEFFLNQGIIGLILLLITMFSGWKKVKKEDKFFVAILCFVNIFPLMFQNGLIDVTFWRVVLINRIIIDYSSYSEKGVIALFDFNRNG